MQHQRLILCTLIAYLLSMLVSLGTLADEPEGHAVLPIDANGRVLASDLFESVADEIHWIAGRVAGFTSIRNDSAAEQTWVSAENVEKLTRLFPQIFSIHTSQSDASAQLHVDRTALATALANRKSDLRTWLANKQQVKLQSLVKVDATWKHWESVEPTRVERIVVLLSGLHGLESGGHEVAKRLYSTVQLPMCVYEYPNDAPLLESTAGFCRVVNELRQSYPRAKISVVAHSMGGLIARAAIELPQVTYAGEHVSLRGTSELMPIDQLVQVCPPNHGSVLAQYAQVLEGFEQIHRWSDKSERSRRLLLRTVMDGFNEAPDDLQPSSEFLAKLNGCKRNPDVKYAILAGDDGPLRARASLLLNLTWTVLSDSVEQRPEVHRAIEELVACPELQAGKGDGVVSTDSAYLPGVKDFLVLDINHLTWGTLKDDGAKVMLQEVCKRLERHQHIPRRRKF